MKLRNARRSHSDCRFRSRRRADRFTARRARRISSTCKNGQHVKSPVLIQFGLAGMGVAPAGSTNANTGHHHLIIDSDTPPAGMPIGMDEKHRHFGGGQTEISVPLTPGDHTLQLVLADGGHVPHNPAVVSEKITVTVDP